jgi:hypothetical protein
LSFEKSKNDIIQQGTLTFRGNLFRSIVSGTVPSRSSSSDNDAIEKASTTSSSSSTIKIDNPDIDSIPTTNKNVMIKDISNNDIAVTVAASASTIPLTSSSSSERQQYDISKPIKLRIDKLQLRDVPDHGTFLDKQDPAVEIRVGKNNKPFETKRAKDAGVNADYSEEFEIDIDSFAFDSEDYMVRFIELISYIIFERFLKYDFFFCCCFFIVISLI